MQLNTNYMVSTDRQTDRLVGTLMVQSLDPENTSMFRPSTATPLTDRKWAKWEEGSNLSTPHLQFLIALELQTSGSPKLSPMESGLHVEHLNMASVHPNYSKIAAGGHCHTLHAK